MRCAASAIVGFGWCLLSWCRKVARRVGGLGSRPQHLARALEFGRSIDTERNGVTEHRRDPHPRLERTQLLQPLAPLEDAGRQRDVALERLAAIGVEADMVVVRAVAARHGGAAEIEGARHAAWRSVRGKG